MKVEIKRLENESELDYINRLESLLPNGDDYEFKLEIINEIINIKWKEVFEKLANE